MTFSTEEQLESFIYDNRNKIHERGLPKFYAHTIRQFRLSDKKIIDLFTFEIIEDVLYFRIIELKKDFIGLDAIIQILGYCGNIKALTEFHFTDVRYEMLLIGTTINPLVICSADLLTPHLNIFLYDFTYEGIFFDKVIHKKRDFNYSETFCLSLVDIAENEIFAELESKLK